MSDIVEYSETRRDALHPDPEPGLVRASQRMLPFAARLLARLGAPLLTVARFRDDRDGMVRLFPWTDRLEPGPQIDPGIIDHNPELQGMQLWGAEALGQVSLRWPGYALPPVVGLVTDGTGLAISGEHPSGLSSHWLLDQSDRESPASVIVPFGPAGTWALLTRIAAGSPSSRCH